MTRISRPGDPRGGDLRISEARSAELRASTSPSASPSVSPSTPTSRSVIARADPVRSGPIRVLVADDHALVREGIRHVLDAEPGIDVVAEAANGREAVELALLHKPDVVVLDITMPEETGLRAAARLRELLPSARVLLLSMHDHVEYVREGMRIGTHGYILKDSAGEELRAAIRAVFAGGTFFSPAVVKRLTASDAPAEPTASTLLELLTPRERDVLAGIARGLTNKAIAAELGISRRTVEAHRESLMRKLEIHNVAGLTRFALEAGLAREG